MEAADMSIMLGNDSLVHQPMNNNKKMINDSGSDVHLDSGYASVTSISCNQTVASAFTSMKKSLEPIAENYELAFNEASGASIIETPTTKSIRQLSQFHIQTPQNEKRMQETTPTKANIFYNAMRSSNKSSTKKNLARSPYKETPNKRNGNGSGANYSSMHLSFTEKMKSAEKHKSSELFDSVDNDNENVENSFEMSPIAYHNKSLISDGRMDGNTRRKLQRHPSGIESSTPISRASKRTHTQTVARTHFDNENVANAKLLLRKTQSFPANRASPVKRANVLKEISTNSPASFETLDEQFEEDEVIAFREHNPARKMLAFSSNEFDTLLTGGASVVSKPAQAEPSINAPTKSLQTKRTSTLQRQQRILLSPSPVIASPTRNEVAKQSIQEKAMRRPMKKLERSISYNPASPNESHIEKVELNTSIYCTPPKSYRRKSLKRTADSAIGNESTASEITAEPPAKRRLYYNGLRRMDILTRLKGAEHVTDLILSMLSDKDLHAAHRVCPSWSQIIKNNNSAYTHQLRYSRALEREKENAERSKVNPTEQSGPTSAASFKREPFARRNVHYSLRPSPPRRSPPCSPATRRFRENQKVVAKLEPGQRLTKCPRCNGNSIVYMASKPSPRKLKPNSVLRKGVSCPTASTSSATFAASSKSWKSFDERKKSDTVISEYAECTRLNCGYSFCTHCNCRRHTDRMCPSQSISSSPPSDEESFSRPRYTRNSQINRRLLLNL